MSGVANKCWRIAARILSVLSAVCAVSSCANGDWWPGAHGDRVMPMYGIISVKLPVGDVGYQPPSPVHSGAVTVFTAQLPQGEITQVEADVNAAGRISQSIAMLDDGVLPDQTAGDRTFTGQLKWKAEYGTGEVEVRIVASGTLDGKSAVADEQLPALTVLP
jgi:hypothetical protein